jgi:hypothetical protein
MEPGKSGVGGSFLSDREALFAFPRDDERFLRTGQDNPYDRAAHPNAPIGLLAQSGLRITLVRSRNFDRQNRRDSAQPAFTDD